MNETNETVTLTTDDLMAEIERHAEATRDLLNRVNITLARQPRPSVPQSVTTMWDRWLALSQTSLQTGFMQLRRAVQQPTTF